MISPVSLIGYDSGETNFSTDLPMPSAVNQAGRNTRMPTTGTTRCRNQLNSDRAKRR